MFESLNRKKKISFPPVLLIVDALAMIGIGLSFGEIFPKHGRSLGLIDSELVWPLLGISLGVAAFCTFKMIRIVSQSNRAIQRG